MVAMVLDRPTLLERDQYMLHPMQSSTSHADPLIIESAEGVWMHKAEGGKVLDAMAGLWNINAGYGRRELADVAHEQMLKVAYCSNYAGMTNLPAIDLAEKLSGYAYPNLKTTYFASGGAEANESAFKTARYFWKRQGMNDKVKIISRYGSYHGVTMAAMSATANPLFWTMFDPIVPNFLHVVGPNPYRFEGEVQDGETIGQAAARALEERIISEGAETVAAIIGEPIQGAGGVILPPDDYWPLVRAICDKHDVLLIADEVITGFGRTGEMFALPRWGIQPDIMSFAKGITSGYFPVGGIQISDAIREIIWSGGANDSWTHGYTYSGHATGCAVALKNIEIIERENLAENSKAMGERLLAGLHRLVETFDHVANPRGKGLICGIEFVQDNTSREPLKEMAAEFHKACKARGLWVRPLGNTIAMSPPLMINEEEVDFIIDTMGAVLDSA